MRRRLSPPLQAILPRKRKTIRDALHAFTLMELLIVIAIIGILAGIVIFAINPFLQIGKARDAERYHTANQLEKAMVQRLIDKSEFLNGNLIPTGLPNAKPICAFGVTGDATCVNLDDLIPDYIATLPKDYAEENPNYTGYSIYKEGALVKVIAAYVGVATGGGASSTSSVAGALAKLYWYDPVADAMKRSNLDGSSVDTVIASFGGNNSDFAFDDTNNTVYWVNNTTHKIMRANYDGSNPQGILDISAAAGYSINAVDPSDQKIYYSRVTVAPIQMRRCNFDGTADGLVLSYNSGAPAFDFTNGKIYYIGTSGFPVAQSTVKSANLDGSSAAALDVLASGNYLTLTFDATNQKVYYAPDSGTQKIQRMNADGTSKQDIVAGTEDISGLAIQGTLGKIYWTEYAGTTVNRANAADGSSQETIATSQTDPYSVHLDDQNSKVLWLDGTNPNYVLHRANYDGTSAQTIANAMLVHTVVDATP